MWEEAMVKNLFARNNTKTLDVIYVKDTMIFHSDVLVQFITKIVEEGCKHEKFNHSYLEKVLHNNARKCNGFHVKWIDIMTKRGAFDMNNQRCKSSHSKIALELLMGIAFTESSLEPVNDLKIDEKNGPAFICALFDCDTNHPLMKLFISQFREDSTNEYYDSLIKVIEPVAKNPKFGDIVSAAARVKQGRESGKVVRKIITNKVRENLTNLFHMGYS
jgi:hypothetical protein